MIQAKHQDDIITGVFSDTMMKDWDNDDPQLQDVCRRFLATLLRTQWETNFSACLSMASLRMSTC